MNKKIIIFFLILIITVLCGIFLLYLSDRKPSNIPTVSNKKEMPVLKAITEEFSKKYSRPADAFVITVDIIDTNNYAKGTVRFEKEVSGGLWFGAKRNGEWKLVFDGNGIIRCRDLENYSDFPSTLIPQCFDENKNILIKR